jgi:hypothetical protein
MRLFEDKDYVSDCGRWVSSPKDTFGAELLMIACILNVLMIFFTIYLSF